MFNRLGAQNPNWITYALDRDVINRTTGVPCSQGACTAGNVDLRPDKRPRPLVVRSVAGSCLTVNFTNLLAPVANPNNAQQDQLINNDQVAGRCAGFHASGTELVDNIASDGSMVGANPGANIGDSTTGASVCGPGMAAPNESRTYNLYTPHEGAFVINSYGATLGSEARQRQPRHRHVRRPERPARRCAHVPLQAERRRAAPGHHRNDSGRPADHRLRGHLSEQPAMVTRRQGRPADSEHDFKWRTGAQRHRRDHRRPEYRRHLPEQHLPAGERRHRNVPSLPNRLEPFREFTSIFHDEQTNSQVFPRWYGNPVLNYTLAGVKDQFMINYGSGGIGSEIIANRLHTGPMHDCTGCAYEEFFLASQTVGDPAQLVQFPANTMIEQCDPTNILDCGLLAPV